MSELPINQIICGDFLSVMKDWPDKCVDLVLTDPPYNVQLGDNHYSARQGGYDIHSDTLTEDSYALLIKTVSQHIIRLSRFSVIAPGNSNQTLWPPPVWTMAWTKKNGCTRTPLTRGQKMNHCCWEPLLVYGKMDEPPKHDLFDCPISFQVNANDHPCPKPLQLFKWLVCTSNVNSLILDPFCGSGTTCVAAKMLGRRYIGIDISPEYCKIAEERLLSVDTGVPVKEARKGQQAFNY